ncbi:hypothetical protein EV361DRAFT_962054 [Lentinula raphanica]|nr:hypothetical protein EV361DRAFT_962054 [Lentinula raphanica]
MLTCPSSPDLPFSRYKFFENFQKVFRISPASSEILPLSRVLPNQKLRHAYVFLRPNVDVGTPSASSAMSASSIALPQLLHDVTFISISFVPTRYSPPNNQPQSAPLFHPLPTSCIHAWPSRSICRVDLLPPTPDSTESPTGYTTPSPSTHSHIPTPENSSSHLQWLRSLTNLAPGPAVSATTVNHPVLLQCTRSPHTHVPNQPFGNNPT